MIDLRRNRIAGLLVAAGAYIVDQALKQYIVGPLDLEARGQLDLLPFFRFTWVKNNGVSLGLLGGDGPLWQWGLVALTGLIAAGVTVWLWRERSRSDAIALGLVLGGALGNITDRARVGHVVDFLDLHFGDFRPFLIFNPADVAISIGVLLLVLRAFLTRDPKRPETVNA